MKVLITGGTGFIGSFLTNSFLEHGYDEVRILTRNLEGKTSTPKVKYFEWDVEKGQMDMAALMGVNAIINLAGENIADGRWTTEKKDRIYNSRINATNLLYEKLKQLQSRGLPLPNKLISTSAIGIYGDRADEELKTDSDASDDFLGQVCRDWEAAAKKVSKLGISVKIIRVGVVLSSEGGALAKMLPAFKMGVAGRIGDGHQYMSWIHIRDLADLYRFLVEHETEKDIIHGVAPNPIENIDFTETLGRVLHRPTFIPLPEIAAKTIFGEMSHVLLDSQKVSCEETKDCGFEYSFNFLEAALRDTLRNRI
ncbi:TIGR01777 family oxidoreductase [Halobacteriovorax sp. DPLXC-1]|uniref:TIGR01777 family oxidoreductase n=1 Tax=unclassified Halobacteriovorax TaxID=2639665 RepID=UPI002FF40CD2